MRGLVMRGLWRSTGRGQAPVLWASPHPDRVLRARLGEGPWAPGFRPGRWCRFCSRYLDFYKQTMDLLTGSGVISSQEVTLPVASAAISHLWQNLSEEKKTVLLEALAQKHSGLLGLEGAPQEPACAEGSTKDSGVDSQGASCSLMSTPEEVSRPWAMGWRAVIPGQEMPGTGLGSLGKFEGLFGFWLTWSVSGFADIISATTKQHLLFLG